MNVARYLVAAARSFPDRPAVSFGTELRWRYGEFSKRVAALAGGLRAISDILPGDRIALAMKNCPQYLEAMYATWHAGLCVVPVNAKLHKSEFAYILENSGTRVCFTTPDLADIFTSFLGEVPSLCRVIVVGDGEYEHLAQSELLGVQPIGSEDPAWLFYTSCQCRS
jgi:acyl-CoA synthetase (AMP-forming)/AMP-acid ligase II